MATQELKLNHLLMPAAKSGAKKMTIRKGVREITVGAPLKLVDASDPNEVVEVTVRAASITELDELTNYDAQCDGFEDWDDMFEGMRQYYPDLEPDSEVTLIYW